MHKLLVRTNYEVLLWHFVDSISKWSEFVSSHLPDFFETEFGYSSEDKKILKEYKKIREYLTYEQESNLFDWAYDKFPNNTKFNELKPLVLYFEDRISKNGSTLKELLLSRLNDINELIDSPEWDLNKINKETKTIIKKISALFPNEDLKTEPKIAYLACSMSDYTQGGANGKNMYTEVPHSKQSNSITQKRISKVLMHEYLHKALEPRNYFKKLGGIFEYKNDSIFPDKMAIFFDEVVIYSLSDVYYAKVDPKQAKEMYSTDEVSYRLWEVIDSFSPHIVGYLNGEMSVEDTRKTILRLCEKTVEEFKKEIVFS